jgi:hypothetical protein
MAPDLERPSGNVTGVTTFDPGQARTQLQFLKAVKPDLERLAILSDLGVSECMSNSNKQAALDLGLKPQVIRVKGPSPDYLQVFRTMQCDGVQALIVLEEPINVGPPLKYTNSLRISRIRLNSSGFIDTIIPATSSGATSSGFRIKQLLNNDHNISLSKAIIPVLLNFNRCPFPNSLANTTPKWMDDSLSSVAAALISLSSTLSGSRYRAQQYPGACACPDNGAGGTHRLSHADLPDCHNASDEPSLRIRRGTDGAGAGAKRQGSDGTRGCMELAKIQYHCMIAYKYHKRLGSWPGNLPSPMQRLSLSR